MPKVKEYPDKIKSYVSLGLKLQERGQEWMGDCPFCGREMKFTIHPDTGQWRCFVCNTGGETSQKGNRGGNVYTFLRLLHEQSQMATQDGDLASLCAQRGYIIKATLEDWGVCKSTLTGEWLVPGYGTDPDKILTLYRYTRDFQSKKMRLFATAELGQHLLGVNLYDDSKDTIYLCEGAWDGMASYETLRNTKKDVEGYTLTGAVPSSLYSKANVLAVPSCSVFDDSWLPLFSGKKVVICFHNDHERVHPRTGEPVAPAAYEGVKRVADRLASSAEHKPKSIHWLEWGEKGYDLDLPSGYDLRDLLTTDPAPRDRVKKLWWMMEKVKPIPGDWVQGRTREAKQDGSLTLELLPCHDYKTLRAAVSVPLELHDGLERALVGMLAIIVSTEAGGDQLWGQFIGPPATGKSWCCEAISTAVRWVTAKSTIRGFHSGYKTDGEGKEDNSLIPLVANKTLVTKDGDTLMTSQNLPQILAEARDLYDRTARTHYRNKVSKNYEGINLTWILCGTGAMADIDTSELGQRFLKWKIMDRIDPETEWRILMRKARRADRAMDNKSEGRPETTQDPETTKAYQLCGGYVEYLRSNAMELLKGVQLDESVYEECARLALFVAYMRARPSRKQKENAEREFATRLTSQFVRLVKCLCVVTNETEATPDVMRRVKCVAVDTAGGRVLRLTAAMREAGKRGCDHRALTHQLGELEQDMKELLVFMKKIGAVELFKHHRDNSPRWKLSDQIIQLYDHVIGQPEELRRAAYEEEQE